MTTILRKNSQTDNPNENITVEDIVSEEETASPAVKAPSTSIPASESGPAADTTMAQVGSDLPDDADFSSFIDTRLPESVSLSPGEKIRATVVSIGDEWIFLDIGGKSEGVVARPEFTDRDGALAIRPGDRVEVFFLQDGKNGKRFTRLIGGSDTSSIELEEAFHGKIPVMGQVVEEIKGGYHVKIGKTRAFCPYSQIALRRNEAENPVGGSLQFRITEIRDRGKSVVVSRRVLLEEEQRLRLLDLQKSLRTGQRVSGTITSMHDFGAFVDIGGLEGLIPAREISWDSSQAISEVLQPGDRVEVEILSLDWPKERFAFSLKRAGLDPWTRVEEHFPPGATVGGTVSRLMPFGAFIRLTAGIEGLIHISKLGDRSLKHPKEALEVGHQLDVRIESIDLENRRISLLPADLTQLKHGGARRQGENQQNGSEEDVAAYLTTVRQQPLAESTLGSLFLKAAKKAQGKKETKDS